MFSRISCRACCVWRSCLIFHSCCLVSRNMWDNVLSFLQVAIYTFVRATFAYQEKLTKKKKKSLQFICWVQHVWVNRAISICSRSRCRPLPVMAINRLGAGGNRAENRSVSQQKEENLIYCGLFSTCPETEKLELWDRERRSHDTWSSQHMIIKYVIIKFTPPSNDSFVCLCVSTSDSL